jgi:cytochrome oxidase Cu insertion factor (SCO1/SenC/PrrC family)
MAQTHNLKIRIALAMLLIIGATTGAAQAATFKKGQKFPAFTLKTVDGKTVSPTTLKNKAYWLTFFASG